MADRSFERQGASRARHRGRFAPLAFSGVFLRLLLMLTTTALMLLAGLACKDAPPPEYNGMDAQSGQRIRVRPGVSSGDQPWQGCYQSPQLGPLALREDPSGAISGRYEYERGECVVVGELLGKRRGNLASFELWELPVDCPGWERLHGQGFLLYSPSPKPGQPSALLGERSYLRARRVSRDKAVLEPYDVRRVTALRSAPIGGHDPCADLETPPDPTPEAKR